MNTIQVSATIHDEEGLHAHPCAYITGVAATFTSHLKLSMGEITINPKVLLEMLTLGKGKAMCGQTVVITASGDDAVSAAARLREILESPKIPQY